MRSKSIEELNLKESDRNFETAKKKPRNRDRDTSQTKKIIEKAVNAEPRVMQKRLSKAEIEQLYEDLMERSQYTEADRVKAALKCMERKSRQTLKRKLSLQHSREKQVVRAFHQNEMNLFRLAWRRVFMEQAIKQRLLAQKLEQMQRADQQQYRTIVARRCESAKPRASLSKLYELGEVQRLLRKRGKTSELKQVRAEKRKLVESCREQQKALQQRIVQEQKKRLDQKQTKRYRSFMERIGEARRDNQRIYRREQHKLKQKYRNVLKNLQHDQIKDFQELCLCTNG